MPPRVTRSGVWVRFSQRNAYHATAHLAPSGANTMRSLRSMGHAIHRPAWLAIDVTEQTVQHGHRVRGLAQQRQQLEQSPERCIIPDEQASSIRQGAHDDPTLGAGSTLVGTVLGL